MKKHYLTIGILAASFGFFAFQNTAKMKQTGLDKGSIHLNAAGGLSGKTGAPLEQNCTQCHNGSVQNGDSENVLTIVNGSLQPVTSYIPGESYTVSLEMGSDPTKKGFNATVLDGSD